MPLRLSWDRAVIYGTILALIASLPFILFPSWFHDVAFRGDFANFWSAGANVGTPTLLDPVALAAWQIAHHITPQVFVYPPGVAWFYAPLARFSPMTGMIVEEAGMAAVLAACGLLAAKIYRFSPWFGLIAVFAWAPALNAIEVGQNTPIALLAILVAIWALVNRREALAGLAVGVLLYKPSAALAFIVLLLVRKEWRALGVCGLIGIGWFMLSVLAAHGNLSWTSQYLHLVRESSISEFAGNSHKTFTLPTLLLSAGVPLALAIAAAIAVFALATPLLWRRPTIEASSMAGAVGVAAGLHAWPYETTLLLPAIFYGAARITEPWRTRLIAAAYFIAASALTLPHSGHGLALLTLGVPVWWLWNEYRKPWRSATIREVPLEQKS
jgi:hypothetical protein